MNDLPRTEEALKRYMVAMQYPFGLLITPEKGWVYRDLYSGESPESVKQVGEFDSTRIWRQKPPRQGLEFEAFVQQWIEDLADFPAELLPPQLKDIVLSGNYRFRLLVTADNAEPAACEIDVTYNGDWNNLRAVAVPGTVQLVVNGK